MRPVSRASPVRKILWFGGIISALVCAYLASLDNPFQYDDIHSIEKNPHIRSLDNIPFFFTNPSLFSEDPKSAMYRPLVLVSYAFNYAISGYRGTVYHGFNLLVHIGNSLLVFILLRILGGNSRQGFWGSLLFGLHPVNSETVNYISSRSESLCALFYLLSFVCYLRGRTAQGVDTRWVAGSLVAFAGALFSKAVGITLVGVLLVYEILCRGNWSKRGLRVVGRLQWPFWALGSVYLLYTRQLVGKALVEQPVRGMGTQILTQAKGLVYYTKLLAVPIGLNVEHQFELAGSLGEPVILISLGLLGSAAWVGLRRGTGFRQKLFWLMWPVIILLPTLIVPLNVLVNEHRLYLPSVALAALGGTFLGRGDGQRDKWIAVVGGLVLLVYGGLDFQRTADWHDPKHLWGKALARAPLMPRPHIYMADLYKDQGEHRLALQHYRQALTVYPPVLTGGDRLIVYNNMGATFLAMGRFVDAVAAYQRALQIDSTYVKARESLDGLLALQNEERNPQAEKLRKQGLNLMIAGRLDEAIASLRSALELQNDPQTWMGLGIAYERKENWGAALRVYEILRQAGPGGKYVETAEEKIRILKERL